MNDVIKVTRSNLNRLQRAYDDAIAEGKESFRFDGSTLLTAYAKYVIEYMRQCLGLS